MQNDDQSRALFARARKVLVGGVNSPVRAFAAVGGEPPFIARGAGCRLWDADGNEFIDYVGSYGPAILGHAPEQVITAVGKAVRNGTSYGAPTELEVKLAEAITSAMRAVEKLRFTSSGTEAVMTAIRLARGATGRSRIVKFIGGYHGHSDALLVQAGSGSATLGVPSSPGVPAGATADTVLVNYNDAEAAAEVFAEEGDSIAAVLVEPVAGNMGVVPPTEGFLPRLRELCDKTGAMLIFDEVMTGFRVARGGAQALFDVQPDLTTLGKVIGGGMPVGAVGGRAEIMDHLAPVGKVYQAGTLSGNPVAMAAGLATLEALADAATYDELERRGAALERGLRGAARQAGLAERVRFNRVGSMLSVFFTDSPVIDYPTAAASDANAFAVFFHAMLERGVYLPPSGFEAWFLSVAHEEKDLQATISAAACAFRTAADIMK